MTYVVSLTAERDSENWDSIARWIEATIGSPGEEWCINTEDDHTLYFFGCRADAEHFERVWARDPLIFPYAMWKEFCVEQLARARFDNHWATVGWTPSSVLILPRNMKHFGKSTAIGGGRREYRPNISCWFFETDTDALIFWMALQ